MEVSDVLSTADKKRRARLLWRLGLASLVLAVFVLGATSWTVFSNWRQSGQDAQRARSNRTYLRDLENLLSDLKDAETGQRGYVLTGEDIYLKPYLDALDPIQQDLAELAIVARQRPDQKPTIDRIQSLTRLKMTELEITVKIRRQANGFKQALAAVLTDRGRIAMTQIRVECKRAIDQENSATLERAAEAQASQNTAIELALGGSLLLLFIMVAGVATLNSGAAQQAQLAESLANSKELFETTLTSIGDGVLATDTSGRITFMNPEAASLTGWSRTEVMGKKLDEVFQIFNESTRAKAESPFDKVLQTGHVVGLANHTILRRKDGSEIPIDDSGAPIRNVQGSLGGVVLVFRGVEERRRAEAELERSHAELLKANEELRQFSYAATHDLQEPLRTIVVFSQLLSRTYKGSLDERGQHLLKTVEDAGHRMSSLINDLLAFTRAGSSDTSTANVLVDPAEILRDTLAHLNGAIEETRATISHQQLPMVLSEPAQLSQVFQNLISNAIKYRKPGHPPVIKISADVEGDHATFQIADNGMGFKQEYSDRIFLLFQRLHGRNIPGTGIGLALCRRIIERQGGRIWVRSEENVGSTFFFTLPLAR